MQGAAETRLWLENLRSQLPRRRRSQKRRTFACLSREEARGDVMLSEVTEQKEENHCVHHERVYVNKVWKMCDLAPVNVSDASKKKPGEEHLLSQSSKWRNQNHSAVACLNRAEAQDDAMSSKVTEQKEEANFVHLKRTRVHIEWKTCNLTSMKVSISLLSPCVFNSLVALKELMHIHKSVLFHLEFSQEHQTGNIFPPNSMHLEQAAKTFTPVIFERQDKTGGEIGKLISKQCLHNLEFLQIDIKPQITGLTKSIEMRLVGLSPSILMLRDSSENAKAGMAPGKIYLELEKLTHCMLMMDSCLDVCIMGVTHDSHVWNQGIDNHIYVQAMAHEIYRPLQDCLFVVIYETNGIACVTHCDTPAKKLRGSFLVIRSVPKKTVSSGHTGSKSPRMCIIMLNKLTVGRQLGGRFHLLTKKEENNPDAMPDKGCPWAFNNPDVYNNNKADCANQEYKIDFEEEESDSPFLEQDDFIGYFWMITKLSIPNQINVDHVCKAAGRVIFANTPYGLNIKQLPIGDTTREDGNNTVATPPLGLALCLVTIWFLYSMIRPVSSLLSSRLTESSGDVTTGNANSTEPTTKQGTDRKDETTTVGINQAADTNSGAATVKLQQSRDENPENVTSATAPGLPCMVCKIQPRNVITFPCSHLVMCHDCASQRATCPKCNATIRGTCRATLG